LSDQYLLELIEVALDEQEQVPEVGDYSEAFE
jgi:hypothetical protein